MRGVSAVRIGNACELPSEFFEGPRLIAPAQKSDNLATEIMRERFFLQQ